MSLRIGIDLGGTKIEAVGARRRRRGAIPPPRSTRRAATTTARCAAIAGLVARGRARPGERGTVGVGMPGQHLAGDRAGQERELDLADRPSAAGGSRARAGAPGAARERCELLRAVGSGRRRGRRAPRRLRRDSGHRHGRWGRRGRAGARSAPTRSPGSGATTRCRGPTRTSGRARRVIAAAAAASKRSSRGQVCKCAYAQVGQVATARARSRRPPSAATARAAAADRDLRTPPREGAGDASSTCSIPTSIVLGGGLSNIESLYRRVPEIWTDWVFSDRVDTRLARARHGDSSGVRGAAWLWPRLSLWLRLAQACLWLRAYGSGLMAQAGSGLMAYGRSVLMAQEALGRAKSSCVAVIRKCEAFQTTLPSRSRIA